MIFTCTATGIEVIELNYGEEVLYNVSKRLEDPQIHVMENCGNNTSAVEHERTLEHKTSEGKTWSHSGTIHKGRPHQWGGMVGTKSDIVREVAWIYHYRSSQNAVKGGRGPKSPKFC